jgi:hypothetical protein
LSRTSRSWLLRLRQFEEAERIATKDGLTFAEAMRIPAGADVTKDLAATGTDPDWSHVVAGPWLAETLKGLRSPEALAKIDPGCELHGTLRPYQQVGVRWLHLLSRLGLPGRRHGAGQDHPDSVVVAGVARRCEWQEAGESAGGAGLVVCQLGR